MLAAFAAFWCLYKCLQLLHPPLPPDLAGTGAGDVFSSIVDSSDDEHDAAAQEAAGANGGGGPDRYASMAGATKDNPVTSRTLGKKKGSFLGWTSLVADGTRRRANSRAL